ncbi:MAG: ABC transporter ATP-binding protein/permease [Lactobacillus sp.]|jgi:ATP-binding cassette subfamily B protein|nr:ABC transporter ATP-binding protein/permease [Lactobacillus sp.]MCI1466670.1 ABC transporter ATP-binding protein/permease [Lactobacillus sp.]MCI1480924.1 ABC transporter ATP-binding protein/permease [Lactobacillus sp.]MCI1942567.1 ABC transporter ATP-binding protein/permease [Lactobacillus sp.]MCI1973266.1 ABC transporter ATP-binding protein/permease [Lactobacillus sp.]
MDQEKQTESIWSKPIPLSEQWQILKRLFKFVKPFRWEMLVATIGAFIVSGINMLLPHGLQYFIDHYLVTKSATTQIILWAGLLYGLGVILKAIMQFTYEFYFAYGSEKTLESIRKIMFRHLHKLGMRFFDQTPTGAIVSRVTNDTMTLSNFLTVLASVIMAIFSLVTAFIAMFTTNVTAAWLMVIFIPIIMLVIAVYTHFSSRLYRKMRERLSRINTSLNENIEGMGLIQEFKQEDRMRDKFEAENGGLMQTRMSMIHLNSLLLSPLTSLLYSAALTVVLLYFGFPLHETFVSAGVLYAFSQYLSQFFNPFSTMMDQMTLFQDGIVAGKRIFQVLDTQEFEPVQHPEDGLQIKAGKIEFKHVSFSYDGKHEILHDLSFTVEPGQTLGIVGHTGSGKSTIINVMLRFYEYYQGQILIDGHDLKSYPLAELRAKLGLVLQEPFMFSGDIASNIRLYNQQITDEQIQTAAKAVRADEFIQKQPGKYHAKVLEGGSELSQGQRQLLSFARTLVTNPKILVLDEATANVDTETEELIQAGLKRLRQGRTTLAIAHRLSTIADADQIIVLDKGRIVEHGTHEELLAQKGYYYSLYNLQVHTE